jgi:hypothetical protein
MLFRAVHSNTDEGKILLAAVRVSHGKSRLSRAPEGKKIFTT